MTETDQCEVAEESLRERLEKERGPIDYLELQKFFAKGVILIADSSLDLVAVAEKIHADDTDCIGDWIDAKLLTRAHDEHAKKWLGQQSRFEAVTMMPWVVVQELNTISKEKTQ